MIEQVFFAALSSAPSVEAIASTRIYPLVLPEEAQLPAISYLFVGGNSKATQDTRGNQRYRIEVNCWGETYGDAVTLRHTVISELDQYRANNIFIQLLQPVDFFDHESLEYRATVELYVYSNFA
jgi:hypothetical protein